MIPVSTMFRIPFQGHVTGSALSCDRVRVSQVYQVLDHKKQLFAVKYVNLEEADAQTVESYKNEIEHLNHLQQYSDQIIKLYD